MQIGRTNNKEKTWLYEIYMTKEEAQTKKCDICNEPLKNMAVYYACNICKSIYCSECIPKKRIPCNHHNYYFQEYEYYCGHLKITKENIKLQKIENYNEYEQDDENDEYEQEVLD